MPTPSNQKGSRFIPALIIGVVSFTAWKSSGFPPVVSGGQFDLLPSLTVFGMAVSGLAISTDALRLLARFLDWRKAKQPTGLKGTSGWAALRDLRGELKRHEGIYLGAVDGKAVRTPFESSVLIVGPSGSGKNVSVYQPNAMAMEGVDKVFIDFRSDQTAVLAKPLKARGEDIITINLGGLYEDIVGPSAHYNLLCVLLDDLERPGGLRDIVENTTGLCLWLYPEPGGGESKDANRYFRDGSRTLLSLATLLCVLTLGMKATLGDVSQLLQDRTRFLLECQWAAGRLAQEGGGASEMPILKSKWVENHSNDDVQRFIDWFRAQADGVATLLEAPDTRTVDSFITGAQQALSVFNITTRAARICSRTDFRFAQLKEGKRPTNVFFMLDPNKIESQSRILGLLIYCMLLELRRHPNKRREVVIFADEISNIDWPGLGSLITWARAYSVKLVLFLQNFPACRAKHSGDTVKTIQSESELQLYLPHQRESETLSFIESKLGTTPVTTRSNRGSANSGPFGLDGFDFREDGRPLMTADEIRRCDHGILFIRNQKPLKVDLPHIAAIAPWRKLVGINPFFGKKFLLPVALRIKRRGVIARLYSRLFKR